MKNIDFTQVELKKIVTHQVGNKLRDEGVQLSSEETIIEGDSKNYLLKYFFSSIKLDELYEFSHSVKIEMNEVYSIVSGIFEQNEGFVEYSKDLAKLLYEQSMHPKVKEGQLSIAYFANAIIDDEVSDAIGVFKSETYEPFIRMRKRQSRFSIDHEFGLSVKEIDKGCLIFNTDHQSGYKVLTVDRASKNGEAQYWKEDFLNIKPSKNEFYQTNQYLNITKQFVTKQLVEDFEISKIEQIGLLNRSVEYFKSHEAFSKEDFEQNVFEHDSVIELFKKFDQSYRKENELDLVDNFTISPQAVKKQMKIFKKVIKLDDNFDIHIHGNKELIEQGVDKDGRKYYKIYYEKEI